MKILCTGSTGFVGAGLIPALRKKGHSVVLLSRRREGGKSADPDLRSVTWNGRDTGAWAREVDGADAVVNFAGEPLDRKRWTKEQKQRIVDSRVNATRAVVRAIREASGKPEVLINASGVGFYGDTGDALVTEESPPGKDFLAETCVRWEEEAWAAETCGVRTVVLRSGPALDREGGALPKLVTPFKLYGGGPLGSGKQWFPWVHRDDLVSVILTALDNRSYSGPINVAAPESVTNKQFCKALGKVLHRPCWFPVPKATLTVALGEMSEMVLTGQHIVPAKLKKLGYAFLYPKLEPALNEILGKP
jgi:uncharacterized protein